MVTNQQKLQDTIKSIMKKTLKKRNKPLKVATENLVKSNFLLKEATIATEKVAQQHKDFERTSKFQKVQYEEILKVVENSKLYESVP